MSKISNARFSEYELQVRKELAKLSKGEREALMKRGFYYNIWKNQLVALS